MRKVYKYEPHKFYDDFYSFYELKTFYLFYIQHLFIWNIIMGDEGDRDVWRSTINKYFISFQGFIRLFEGCKFNGRTGKNIPARLMCKLHLIIIVFL